LGGWLFIRRKNVAAHKACMLAAFSCSTIFLACYLYYHFHVGHVPYRGPWRLAYFSILLTHTTLAVVILPLILRTLYLGLNSRFDNHVWWARRTLPLWAYVSVTGVIIYLMVFGVAHAEEPSLTFQVSGQPAKTLTLTQLKGLVTPYNGTFFDPLYGKTKSYECLPIAAVIDAGFGPKWQDGVNTEAVLRAMDGYASVSPALKLTEEGGCLAFADLDFPNWESIGRKKVNPGPFYLAWAKPEQSTQNDYPWPYQLASISLVKFEERYPEVVPVGAKAGSPAWHGFEIFKARCLRCHSINQQGGKIGPDLNAPQSIASYRSKKWIKSWIRQPSKYRYTEMPDHLDLTDADLEGLYQYFRWKSRQPEKKAF
jgi:mono/diheme cytochrome c family protein